MTSFPNVELRLFDESSFTCRTIGAFLTLNVDDAKLVFFRNSEVVKEIVLRTHVSANRLSNRVVAITLKKEKPEKIPVTHLIAFESPRDLLRFLSCIKSCDANIPGTAMDSGLSSFDKRTDSWSAVQYFQFYSYLSQQQNMMQDYVRTSTYQRAILFNASMDFRGKVVLDVGAGSGILSFFAIQAGATKVYAVEASNMAAHCNTLVQANKLAGRIVVISGKIEEITLPEPVDIIISEPMGYMLYNERMLETYVHARKFLAPHLRQPIQSTKASAARKNELNRTNHVSPRPRVNDDEGQPMDGTVSGSSPVVSSPDADSPQSDDELTVDDGDMDMQKGEWRTSSEDGVTKRSNRAIIAPGIMFPTVANLYIVPFSDEALFAEQSSKANFWHQQTFHGMDLTSLRSAAFAEYFNQPIVDTFDIGLCPALPCVHKVDFRTVSETQLASIDIPLHFQISTCSTIHGLAFWFDVGFLGSQREVWLSTAPTEPLTHWYQVRCLLGTPLFVQEGQALNGHVTMRANSRQSYDVQIELIVPGSQTKITNSLDLKNPHFRYNGYPPAPPPGSHVRSPTETYYANLCLQQQLQVQAQPSAGLSVPLAAAAAAASGPLFAMHPATAFVQTSGPTESALPQAPLQSMQMSPHPITPSPLAVMTHTSNPGAGIPQSHPPAQPSAVLLDPSTAAVSGLFCNPTVSVVAEDSVPQSTNGWRPGNLNLILHIV
ncbi:Histone-arginine methyltransferase CARM1 [Fasciolopsis buskii]|uniref:type I protein arginine methyltransferase n=1 Tax=Fasciolopsis buskii TaxID=27845 RepID=A0A8E0S0J5_9TREM|nr:Histone-arginine methyltransferase CARM1 [Fasciolopsis buski]